MIEKILERLEAERCDLTDYKSSEDRILVRHWNNCVDVCKEIVQEVAKEYGNGWIPCSERLPSKEEYQKCNGQFIVSDGNRTYATYFDIYDTLKFGELTMTNFRVDRCVIAWQPLPAVFRPKEDQKMGGK